MQKAKQKKRPGALLLAVAILLSAGIAWSVIRKTGSILCSSVPDLPGAAYSENDAVCSAIALSYLVYGCETCDALSGTIRELIDTHEMGILQENFGIKRTDADNPASALLDTSAYIDSFVGDFRFLCDLKDEKNSFYGAAFCDDRAECVWIAYAGSVSFRDAIACAELVLAPRLSGQERQAFALFASVLQSAEVQDQNYRVMLTGHSLGGALATMVACASGCRAVTINGADGIAVEKYRAIEGGKACADNVSNYLTSPKNGRFYAMDLVQRLMFLGDSQAVDAHVYPENGRTTDTHSAFSFLAFEVDALNTPKLP